MHVALVLWLCASVHGQQQPWRYVVPSVDLDGAGAPARALALSANAPDGVEVDVAFVSPRPRFAQIRFGSASSVRVAVALDEVEPGRFELFVDAGRDRRLDAADRVAPVELRQRCWRLGLDAIEVGAGAPVTRAREVEFRLGGTGSVLGFVVRGRCEGSVVVGEATVRGARVDGDGNGRLTDSEDQVLLDLDGDGAFEPLLERFLYRPVLRVGDRRFAVGSVGEDDALVLRPLEGLGRVTCTLGPHPAEIRREVLSMTATLVSADGVAVAVRTPDEPVSVPVGRYRTTNLQLTLADPDGGTDWNFVFSEVGGPDDWRWYDVAADGEITVEVLGELAFSAGLGGPGEIPAGATSITIRPRLYTADGLLINNCFRAASADNGGAQANVELLSDDGQILDSHNSGFA